MTAIPQMADTTDRDLDLALDAAVAAAPAWEECTPRERARALVAIADALQSQADPLVTAAHTETGLPEARLRSELTRTSVQLRMFAEELIVGRFFDVVIDRADPGFALGPRPDLRRYHLPIGPVLVFAASNFPFAFSVAGSDTASALAAGCPVLLKAHPGHPHTSAPHRGDRHRRPGRRRRARGPLRHDHRRAGGHPRVTGSAHRGGRLHRLGQRRPCAVRHRRRTAPTRSRSTANSAASTRR